MERVTIHAIWEQILDRRLVPLHQNTHAITELNGILEDVKESVMRTEEFDGTNRVHQQEQ